MPADNNNRRPFETVGGSMTFGSKGEKIMGLCMTPVLENMLAQDVKAGKITEDQANTVRALAVGADDSVTPSDGKLTKEEWAQYSKNLTPNTATDYVTRLFQNPMSCGYINTKKPVE